MSVSALPADVAETHSAVVVFVGDRAYKLKKAVDLGFLDFRRREAREAICHREVELNRRLAPDVYLGVADVHDPAGQPCDHLVVMRRMPPERRLSTLVQTGQNVDDELWDLAHLMAPPNRTTLRIRRHNRCPAHRSSGKATSIRCRYFREPRQRAIPPSRQT